MRTSSRTWLAVAVVVLAVSWALRRRRSPFGPDSGGSDFADAATWQNYTGVRYVTGPVPTQAPAPPVQLVAVTPQRLALSPGGGLVLAPPPQGLVVAPVTPQMLTVATRPIYHDAVARPLSYFDNHYARSNYQYQGFLNPRVY